MPKRRRLTVGLTGGIGSGKSETLEIFARAGAETVSLDRIAHELSKKGKPLYKVLVKAFGREILDAAGRIDRRTLGERVFNVPALRRRLEAATHPVIRREWRRRLATAKRKVVVVDVPLLFEGKRQKDFDVTILVTAPRSRRISRVRRRDGLKNSQILKRMRAQMPDVEKRRLADVVIRNDGSLKDLARKVREYQNALQLIAGG